jgi:hypothetical protein
MPVADSRQCMHAEDASVQSGFYWPVGRNRAEIEEKRGGGAKNQRLNGPVLVGKGSSTAVQ